MKQSTRLVVHSKKIHHLITHSGQTMKLRVLLGNGSINADITTEG